MDAQEKNCPVRQSLSNEQCYLQNDFLNYLRFHLGREQTSDIDYKLRALVLGQLS